MRFNWLCNCWQQQQFLYYWCPEKWTLLIIEQSTTPPHTTSCGDKYSWQISLAETSDHNWVRVDKSGKRESSKLTQKSTSFSDLSSCMDVLESPKIPNPNSGQWTDNPDPNTRKGTDNPMHGKWADTFKRKKQQAQARTRNSKILLINLIHQQTNTKNLD